MNCELKKICYSGIQPTGVITLGNYIGAVANWKKMQEEMNCVFGVADLHALSVRQSPQEFREASLKCLATLLAVGLDYEKAVVYFQSHVRQHAELMWILNCYTYIGEMQRMTQFKDKSQKHEENINMGLLSYPVLQAADILLYQANFVPVGQDQKQHIEITRDIAVRFNNLYSDTFTIPEIYLSKHGAKIMSLQNPEAKMSKSDLNTDAFISVLDEPDVIRKKFKKAVTDSGSTVEFSDDKKGVSNLLTIFSCATGTPIEKLVEEYYSLGYGRFKTDVAEAVIESLKHVRENYNGYINDKAQLMQIAKLGADKAAYLAEKTLRKVKKKIGLVELK
jgi:tryptophanyl-tRNA synthetase